MSLTIIMGGTESIDAHARRAVREVMEMAAPSYMPQLPERAESYMRHYCNEGHHFWAPMTYHSGLCSECREDEAIREKWRN